MFEDGRIDWQSFRNLIDWQILAGSDAVVVMGSTGESATVSIKEHCDIVSEAIRHSNGRIPVIAGTGANATDEAIELTDHARAAGAAAALSVVPYYNKPTQNGIFQHFKTIAEAVDIPLILYNVPGRTVTDMTNDTVLRLAELPNIQGLKDATGDIARGMMLMRSIPADFVVYSGDDPSAAALLLLGAQGVISVSANVIPVAMSCLCAASRSGDIETVKRISNRIAPLHQAMFVESNPIPVKWLLAKRGIIQAHCRSPLTPLDQAWHELLSETFNQATGILANPDLSSGENGPHRYRSTAKAERMK